MPHAYVQSTRLWYAEAGSGPALLLVHGFPLDSRIWDDVLPLLTPHRRVITLDLRSFGQSDPLAPGAGFSMRQLALDVAGFCTLHKVAPCAMAGLSMGGYVLQELASEKPEMIRHLVLLDTKAEADSTEARNKRNAMADLVGEKGPGAVADQMMPNMLAPGAPPEVRRKLRAIMESQRVDTIASACIAMRDREDYVNLLPRLSMPVDIIVGEHDAISPPTLMRAMHERLAYGRYFVIPGAGHLSPMENPRAVAEALLRTTEACEPAA
jgi:3-oxoadipate enol-lactonase